MFAFIVALAVKIWKNNPALTFEKILMIAGDFFCSATKGGRAVELLSNQHSFTLVHHLLAALLQPEPHLRFRQTCFML